MASPPEALFPCPYCRAPVGPQQSHCAGCQARLLYGLVAAPQSDARIQDRAAAVLTAVPGGPAPAEARRRVREGLPLIVGLSRRRTEELQSRLVDAGLVPRIGPAPRGTPPLEPERASRILARRVAVAVAIPVLAFALFRFLGSEPPPAPDAAPGPNPGREAAVTPAPRLELRAGFERARHGHLWLVCYARVQEAGAPPESELVLRLRDGTGTVIWTGSLSPSGAVDRTVQIGDETLQQRSLSGRLSLADVFLEGGERLTLEGNWQGRESAPAALEVPPPIPLR